MGFIKKLAISRALFAESRSTAIATIMGERCRSAYQRGHRLILPFTESANCQGSIGQKRAWIATAILLLSGGAYGTTWCEACPGGMLHHCETNTWGYDYDWQRISGPFGWDSPNGYSYRRLLCNTTGTAEFRVTILCGPPGNCQSQIFIEPGSATCGGTAN